MKKLVLFVCSGNTCRSPMAEGLFKKALHESGLEKKFIVSSAGIMADSGSLASAFATAVMKELGISIEKHTAQNVTEKLLTSAHAVFCLSNLHRKFLLSQYKNIEQKCFLIKQFFDCENKDVSDPFGGEIEEYKRVRDEISLTIDSILKFLTYGNEN